MKFWWPTIPRPGNMGDILTPAILKAAGVKFSYGADREFLEAIMIGSFAKFAVPNTHVFGTGIMSKPNKLNPLAKWHWVRGPLTRDNVIRDGGSCPQLYGDSAMLLPLVLGDIQSDIKKCHRVGIMPHYVDFERVNATYGGNYRVINILNANPIEVVKSILECEKIISSSLHGLIVAHTYNIPAAWIKFSNKLSGDDSKFYDHYRACGTEPVLSASMQALKYQEVRPINMSEHRDILCNLLHTQS
jgi:pyruvyltransferase